MCFLPPLSMWSMEENTEEMDWLCKNSWSYQLEQRALLMPWEWDLKFIITWWKLLRRNTDWMLLMLVMKEDLPLLLMMAFKLCSSSNLLLNLQVTKKLWKSEWTVQPQNFSTNQLRNTIFTSRMINFPSQFPMSPVHNCTKFMKATHRNILSSPLKILLIKTTGKAISIWPLNLARRFRS